MRHVNTKGKSKGRSKAKLPRGRNVPLTQYQPKQRDHTGARLATQQDDTHFEMTMPPTTTGKRQVWSPDETQPRPRLSQQRQEAQRRHGRNGPFGSRGADQTRTTRSTDQTRTTRSANQTRTTRMPGTGQTGGTHHPRDLNRINPRGGHKERFVILNTMCLVYKDELRRNARS